MSNPHEPPDWTKKLFSSSDEWEDPSEDEVTIEIEFTPEGADDEDGDLGEETTWEWNGSSWRQVN